MPRTEQLWWCCCHLAEAALWSCMQGIPQLRAGRRGGWSSSSAGNRDLDYPLNGKTPICAGPSLSRELKNDTCLSICALLYWACMLKGFAQDPDF